MSLGNFSRRGFMKGLGVASAALGAARFSSAPALAQIGQPGNLDRSERAAEMAPEHFKVRRQPIKWPNDARIAIFWVVDFELFSDNANSADIAYYDYSGKAGFWRLIDIFDENDVKTGWYTNSLVALRFPETLREAARRGHEIDGHGYTNDNVLSSLDPEVERQIIKKVFQDIEKVSGVRPTGWLGSGWNTTPKTLESLVDEGIIWNGDYPIDDLPYTVMVKGKKLVIIPYHRESNDIQLYAYKRYDPQIWLDSFKTQFDVLYEEGDKYPQLLNVPIHSWAMGHPAGKKFIREAIRYVKGFPHVWLAKENDIAKWWLQQNYD